VDAAIDGLLDEAPAGQKPSASDDEVAEEELGKELAELIEQRRREERREAKKTMERQKKQEWRRKAGLGGSQPDQEEVELFKNTARNVLALEDEDQYVDPAKESEDSGDEAPESESDSDDGLDRLARMEVDIAVRHELGKLRLEDTQSNKMQRQRKKKKETRRERLMAAWSGELAAFSEAIDVKAGEELALQNEEQEEEDDDDEEELQALRAFQKAKEAALADETTGPDAEALRALADGPPRPEAPPAGEAEDGEEEPRETSTALVPVAEPSFEELRSEQRMSRWFSQDIFQAVGGDEERLGPMYGERSDDEGSGAEVKEVDESLLPKLPLTDKEKRKLKRKKDKEWREMKTGKKSKTGDEDNRPVEVAPLEAPRPLVPMAGRTGKFQKPSDPRELAETLALGSILVDSKKSRMDLIDAAYNRWTFDADEGLPDWFSEEECKYNRPELPISKELMDQFRAKLREINARPIRKVTQARARKQRRLKKRLEKLRSTAMSLADTPDTSEHSKAKQMRRAMRKLAGEERKVTVVAIRKGGGSNRGKLEKGKVPKGAKVKVVDRRMKSDRRGEKKANLRNPQRPKITARRLQRKKAKSKRGGGPVGKQDKRRTGDGKGIHGGGT